MICSRLVKPRPANPRSSAPKRSACNDDGDSNKDGDGDGDDKSHSLGQTDAAEAAAAAAAAAPSRAARPGRADSPWAAARVRPSGGHLPYLGIQSPISDGFSGNLPHLGIPAPRQRAPRALPPDTPARDPAGRCRGPRPGTRRGEARGGEIPTLLRGGAGRAGPIEGLHCLNTCRAFVCSAFTRAAAPTGVRGPRGRAPSALQGRIWEESTQPSAYTLRRCGPSRRHWLREFREGQGPEAAGRSASHQLPSGWSVCKLPGFDLKHQWP